MPLCECVRAHMCSSVVCVLYMCMCVYLAVPGLGVSVCLPLFVMGAKSSFASIDKLVFQAPSKSRLVQNPPLRF